MSQVQPPVAAVEVFLKGGLKLSFARLPLPPPRMAGGWVLVTQTGEEELSGGVPARQLAEPDQLREAYRPTRSPPPPLIPRLLFAIGHAAMLRICLTLGFFPNMSIPVSLFSMVKSDSDQKILTCI